MDRRSTPNRVSRLAYVMATLKCVNRQEKLRQRRRQRRRPNRRSHDSVVRKQDALATAMRSSADRRSTRSAELRAPPTGSLTTCDASSHCANRAPRRPRGRGGDGVDGCRLRVLFCRGRGAAPGSGSKLERLVVSPVLVRGHLVHAELGVRLLRGTGFVARCVRLDDLAARASGTLALLSLRPVPATRAAPLTGAPKSLEARHKRG